MAQRRALYAEMKWQQRCPQNNDVIKTHQLSPHLIKRKYGGMAASSKGVLAIFALSRVGEKR